MTAADSSAFDVTVGTASQFLVTPTTSTPNAGSQFSVTLMAEDAGGNTVTTYTGNHTIAWGGAFTSPAGNAPSYPATTASFTTGVSTTTLIATLYAAGSNPLIASATVPSVTGSALINVSALAASRLAWTSVTNSAGTLSGVCSFTCTYTGVSGSGTTFSAKISLTDVYGNPVNNSGSAFNVTVTMSLGTFTGSAIVTIPSGVSQSNSGGDGIVAGEITFVSRTGNWTTDTLSMTNSGGISNNASASFSK